MPNLTAKPIIDILVAPMEWPLATVDQVAFEALGYEYLGTAGVSGREYFRRRGAHDTNLAVVEWGGTLWEQNLVLRDYLRENSPAAEDYGRSKVAAWQSGADTLLVYSNHKAAEIAALIEAARKWRAGQHTDQHRENLMTCIACQIAKKGQKANIVLETDNVIVFLDHAPINPGHLLICPKLHVENFDNLSPTLMIEINEVSKRAYDLIKMVYDPEGISFIQNNGLFNDLGHYHIHIFPRYRGDGFGWVARSEEIWLDELLEKELAKIKAAISSRASATLGSQQRC